MQHSHFVHLHVHTQFSLLDGACKIPELIALAKEYKMPALAITDHGNMFGAIEFYSEAMKNGIKPIIGCEIYVAPGSRFDRATPVNEEASYHLILLAKDEEGYRNLMKLVSAGYLEGFYYKPRVDKELLAKYSKGLIAQSACLQGELGRAAASISPLEAVRRMIEDLLRCPRPERLIVLRHYERAGILVAVPSIGCHAISPPSFPV